MSPSDFWQLIISGLGIAITIGVIWGGQKRLQGRIEERLKAGDKNFETIFHNCEEHDKDIDQLEVSTAKNTQSIEGHERRIIHIEDKIG